jgi:flagellar hook-associated protein 1 FlgK
MSLELAINNALTGLNVNQKALSVVAQNISNANTAGYSRKTLDQSAIYVGREQIGAGVKIDDVVRKVETYLQRTLRSQTSISEKAKTVDDYLSRLQVLLGQPGDVNTVDEYLSTFFNQMQALAETPERVSFREQAVDAAEIMAREISGLAGAMHDLRLQADQDISENIRRLNRLLGELDLVNSAISNASVLGNPISGLQDEQDMIVDEISQIVDIDVLVQEQYQVFIYTANGVPLLDDSAYEVDYRQVRDVSDLEKGNTLAPIEVYRLDEAGNRLTPPQTLVTSGVESTVTTDIAQGQMKALLDLRDTVIPSSLAQLDQLSSVLRDVFNTIHNEGSSFPGTDTLTGTRAVSARDVSDWSGKLRIAVLDENGAPITSPYNNESYTGTRPLTLDLSKLDGGTGNGQPNVQTIIDEINHYFAPPPIKANLGNLQNIQLVSQSTQLPAAPPSFTFDFDLENIAAFGSDFFVSGVTVLDDTATNITNVTTTRPALTISQYNTTAGLPRVTVNAAGHGLVNGDIVYLEPPAAAVDGIPPAEFGRYFQVSNVTSGSFTVDVGTPAVAGGATVAGTERVIPKYDTIAAGETRRVKEKGSITANLAANPNSTYYDIQINVGVRPTNGTTLADVKTSTITFRIPNNQTDLRNDRYTHTAVTGAAIRSVPSTASGLMKAILVDANGVELPQINGKYQDVQGFLKLVTQNDKNTIAIDSMDSKQLGVTSTSPQAAGTNRGFSHYFELNNFFKSNAPTATGDTTKGSALNLAVEKRLMDNANLISIGQLERTNQPANPTATPLYSYERRIGNNTTIQKLAKLDVEAQSFAAAGGLDASRQSFNGYAGEMLGSLANSATTAASDAKSQSLLLEGFAQRMDAYKGVNVDEELANTVIYQNAYNASARIISVAGAMFDALFAAVSQ